MKYTIELTDTEYNVLTGFMDMISTEIKAEYFQKAKLEPTEKAWEDKLAETKAFAYNDGFENGKLWATEEYTKNRQGYYDDAYNNALEDESIKVGDEVETVVGNKVIVTRIYNGEKIKKADVLFKDGSTAKREIESLSRTGRNFGNEVEQLFDKLRGKEK